MDGSWLVDGGTVTMRRGKKIKGSEFVTRSLEIGSQKVLLPSVVYR
jgi:hypothetical protein